MYGYRGWSVLMPRVRIQRQAVYRPGVNLTANFGKQSWSEEKVVERKDHAKLMSIAHSQSVWHSNTITAKCLRGGHKGEKAPVGDCTCGIYAFYEYDSVLDQLGLSYEPGGLEALYYEMRQSQYSIGVIQGWGKIILHELGFRSEHMSIVGFIDDGPGSNELAKRYDVGVMSLKEAQNVQSEFDEKWRVVVAEQISKLGEGNDDY